MVLTSVNCTAVTGMSQVAFVLCCIEVGISHKREPNHLHLPEIFQNFHSPLSLGVVID